MFTQKRAAGRFFGGGGGRGIAPLFLFNLSANGVGGQRHALAALPPGKTRYLLCRRLGRPQGRSGWVRKISSTPAFDPRTIQHEASRYTDCAIPAHIYIYWGKDIFFVISSRYFKLYFHKVSFLFHGLKTTVLFYDIQSVQCITGRVKVHPRGRVEI